jgi:hypothetical protein
MIATDYSTTTNRRIDLGDFSFIETWRELTVNPVWRAPGEWWMVGFNVVVSVIVWRGTGGQTGGDSFRRFC